MPCLAWGPQAVFSARNRINTVQKRILDGRFVLVPRSRSTCGVAETEGIRGNRKEKASLERSRAAHFSRIKNQDCKPYLREGLRHGET